MVASGREASGSGEAIAAGANSDPGGASDRTLALLALAGLSLWVGVARVWAGDGAIAYLPGVLGMAWFALGSLGFAWVFSRCSSPQFEFRFALTVVCAWSLFAIATYALIASFGSAALNPWQPVILGVPALATFSVVLRRYRRRLVLVTLLATLGYFVGVYELTLRLYVDASPWEAAEAPAPRASLPLLDDRTFYDQGERVDAALEQLAPREPNQANVYFLGFAGFGDQRVFAEEIAFAETSVGRRYETRSRSLTLVNDRRDLESHPLATVWNLERALRGIATRMDLEEDILFLVLTSHGDEDGLAVMHGATPLEQLNGAKLREALDSAGIRWRIIVISACHSGAFISDLRDERTLIVTASAAERTSFGCSDDRDLTYFGEAFFRDALPNSPDVQAAFAAARAAIIEREKVEGVDASDPQIDVGAQIDAKWRALERRLR